MGSPAGLMENRPASPWYHLAKGEVKRNSINGRVAKFEARAVVANRRASGFGWAKKQLASARWNRQSRQM